MTSREQQARQCAEAARNKFLNESREAVVSFTFTDFDRAIQAYVRLNFRDEIASSEPSVDLYLSLLRKAFLALLDAGTLEEKYALTSLGWDYIELCRRATGVGLNLLSALKPVVAPVDELREQIRSDWKNLATDKVKLKANNDPAYRKLLNDMLEDDSIGATGATTFTRIEGAPEPR